VGATVGGIVTGDVFLDRSLIDLDVIFPGTDHGKVGTGDGGNAVIGAAGKFKFEFVGEGGTMDLVLIMHGQGVADILGVIAGPFTTGLAKTTGRRPQVGTGTTEILAQIMGQIPEQGLKVFGAGSQQNHVTGGTVHIGHAGAILVPQIHERAQVLGGVVETCRLVDAHGVKMLNTGELIRNIGIPTDNTTTITENTDNAAVLPVGDFILVRQFELSENVPAFRMGLCLLMSVTKLGHGPFSSSSNIGVSCFAISVPPRSFFINNFYLNNKLY